MSDDIGIEVHYDPEHGHLMLACGVEGFARLRDLIFAEAHIPQIIGPPAARATHIEIESVPAVLANRCKVSPSPVGVLVGLAMIAAALVLVVGLRTIWLWCLQRIV